MQKEAKDVQSLLESAKSGFEAFKTNKIKINTQSYKGNAGAVCALRAVCACGMHMSCVHTAHAVCVCERECGPARVGGASDRGPTQATPNPPITAQ